MKDLYKYGRTPHFSFSPGVSKDDKIRFDLTHFENRNVVISTKLDGENTSMYNHHIHARSLDSKDHESRHWVKGLWGNIKHNIPDGWRICGENVYAKHSIYYEDLETYFYVFNIWNENNMCLSFDDTLEWCKLLGLIHVPVLYKGIFDIEFIKEFADKFDIIKHEGFVMRPTESFHYDSFNLNTIKWVRASHVKTSSHWMSEKVIPNKLI